VRDRGKTGKRRKGQEKFLKKSDVARKYISKMNL